MFFFSWKAIFFTAILNDGPKLTWNCFYWGWGKDYFLFKKDFLP